MKKYKVLFGISVILKILGALVLVLGLIASIWLMNWKDFIIGYTTVSLPSVLYSIKSILGIIGTVVSVVVGIILYAYGELIDCFISIEENTWYSKEYLKIEYEKNIKN